MSGKSRVSIQSCRRRFPGVKVTKWESSASQRLMAQFCGILPVSRQMWASWSFFFSNLSKRFLCGSGGVKCCNCENTLDPIMMLWRLLGRWSWFEEPGVQRPVSKHERWMGVSPTWCSRLCLPFRSTRDIQGHSPPFCLDDPPQWFETKLPLRAS